MARPAGEIKPFVASLVSRSANWHRVGYAKEFSARHLKFKIAKKDLGEAEGADV
jgi:hypothetical protein